MKPTTIALDAMGGDHGPRIVVSAALRILSKHDAISLILVGDETELRKCLKTLRATENSRLSIHHAPEQVGKNESPALALRNKKESSMRLAVNLVKDGVASACVSGGNTGALMATARFVLKMLPGIDRPAIVSLLPTKSGAGFYMLDLGANVDSTVDNLFQFAVMGSILSASVKGLAAPRVALLNIGEEDIKGNELVKQTAAALSEYDAINYIGYMEAHQIFDDKVDVVVCDGFVGNVALKASEGTAKLIVALASTVFKKTFLTRLIGLIASPVLKQLKKILDPSRYNGATFLGLQGIVIKSHGSANVLAYEHAIEEAIIEVEKNVPEQIKERLATLLDNGESVQSAKDN